VGLKNHDVFGYSFSYSELCLARKEFSAEFKHRLDGMNDLAKKLGITIQGAYSNEHTVYFIIDSKTQIYHRMLLRIMLNKFGWKYEK
jgi:hypothetical protein